jgi:hypothetical protein
MVRRPICQNSLPYRFYAETDARPADLKMIRSFFDFPATFEDKLSLTSSGSERALQKE